MPQDIRIGIKQLCAEARAEIQEVDVAGARELIDNRGATLVDIRDIRELWRDGKVPGSRHVPRGMVEFWIDPESPYYKDFFGGDGPFIFMCAGGLRSALATHIAQRMGLRPVYNLIGGFGAWKKAEAPIEQHEKTW
ncbi:MAG: rhodanese-like domain-containing protein [Anderseniella sp.]|nr:rhodanese-like domain-containing protein [Anderseniella sp.]